MGLLTYRHRFFFTKNSDFLHKIKQRQPAAPFQGKRRRTYFIHVGMISEPDGKRHGITTKNVQSPLNLHKRRFTLVIRVKKHLLS